MKFISTLEHGSSDTCVKKMLKCSFLIFRASQTGGRAYKVKSPESYLNQIPSITACSKRRVRKSLKTAVSQRLNAVSHWHTVTQWHGVPQCVLPRVSCQNFEYFMNKHLLISKIWIFGPYHQRFNLQNLTADGPPSVIFGVRSFTWADRPFTKILNLGILEF